MKAVLRRNSNGTINAMSKNKKVFTMTILYETRTNSNPKALANKWVSLLEFRKRFWQLLENAKLVPS
jgi:hypothetical protein